MLTIALLIALTNPIAPKTKRFDRIDINHFHDAETGELRFTQLVFWAWSRCERRFGSFGWVMERDVVRLERWRKRAIIERHGERWIVSADCITESWTTVDPEAVDRQRWPDVVREW